MKVKKEPNRWTKPNRVCRIKTAKIWSETVGTQGLSDKRILDNQPTIDSKKIEYGDTIWLLWVETKTGLDKEQCGLLFFASEEEAENALEEQMTEPVGGAQYYWKKRLRDFVENLAPNEEFGEALFYDGLGYLTLIDEILESAGVTNKRGELTMRVIDWVGSGNLEWMQKQYGGNWQAAALFDYCSNNFPHSSLASLAAEILFSEQVTHTPFHTGYLVKELETIYYGVEAKAQAAATAQRKAGESGGQKSSELRKARLEIYMQEIEALSDVALKISEEFVLAQAFQNARARSTEMPKSTKTRLEYETTLRSEEPFKTRYEEVFRLGA